MAISGKSGSVAVGAVDYAFGFWELEFAPSGDDPDTTNFSSLGFYENVAGVDKATATIRGPLSPGNMPLARGTAYSFTFRASAGVTWTITMRVETIRPITDVKDAVRVEIRAVSNGVFVPAIA